MSNPALTVLYSLLLFALSAKIVDIASPFVIKETKANEECLIPNAGTTAVPSVFISETDMSFPYTEKLSFSKESSLTDVLITAPQPSGTNIKSSFSEALYAPNQFKTFNFV